MSTHPHEQYLEVIQREEFLAFFTFAQLPGVGAELTGLVKIARPSEGGGMPINYLSLTFIVDTPDDSIFRAAKAQFGRLNLGDFQRHIPGVRAMTSVPATGFAGPHYVHQLDLVFSGALPADLNTLILQSGAAVRQAISAKTEAPQYWDDPSQAPKKTQDEQNNLGARLKALLGLFTGN